MENLKFIISLCNFTTALSTEDTLRSSNWIVQEIFVLTPQHPCFQEYFYETQKSKFFLFTLSFQPDDDVEAKFNIHQDIIILKRLQQLAAPDLINYESIRQEINDDIRNSGHPMPLKTSKYSVRDRIHYYLSIYDELDSKKTSKLSIDERRKLEKDFSDLDYPFYDE